MRPLFTSALIFLSRRGDLVIAILILVAVMMMIIPLPTEVVDVLITANFGVSILILLAAFYLAHPTQFSSLPAVILIATLFRLAISITTTRLILLQADAGEIVNTFGNFVIAGNIGVGLVVFLIITIAQFVVITKGAERVAEVAARFNLDALPGKQMSIDSDLRSGDIDAVEARRLRHRLERESKLYGAMDGAMKFVKGDAIASLIIIVVNLIGGLAIGSIQHGLSLATAAQTYSLLSVGDGLVAQIPALLVSVAAGTVVTHVASEDHGDLGATIIGELGRDRRALLLASVILLALALIPGFPAYVFAALAAVFGASGYLAHQREMTVAGGETASASPPDAQKGVAVAPLQPEGQSQRHPITLRLGRKLSGLAESEVLRAAVEGIREAFHADLGVTAPLIEIQIDPQTAADRFCIDLDGVPVSEGLMPEGRLLVKDDPFYLDMLDLPFTNGLKLPGRRHTTWVDREHKQALSAAGVAFEVQYDILAVSLLEMLRRHAPQFIGTEETRKLLTVAGAQYPELVKEAEKAASLQKIGEVLRRLVGENIPIKNMRLILEAIVEWAPREKDASALTDYVRMVLGRHICFRCADDNRIIAAYLVDGALEDMIRSSLVKTDVGTFLNAPGDVVAPLLEQVRRLLAETKAEVQPVLLTSMDVRRHVHSLLRHNELDMPVLSYQELSVEFTIQPLGRIQALAGAHSLFDHAWPSYGVGAASVGDLIDPTARVEGLQLVEKVV